MHQYRGREVQRLSLKFHSYPYQPPFPPSRILGLLGFNEWKFTEWHDGDYYYLAAALCWGISNFAVTYEFIVQRKEGKEKMGKEKMFAFSNAL